MKFEVIEMSQDRECYYISVGNKYLCELEDGIGWSRYIIDATSYGTEEEAEEAMKKHEVFFGGVSCRSGPPQDFLYRNPYLPPKEERISKMSVLDAYKEL